MDITPHGFDNLGGRDKKDDPRDFKLGTIKATPVYNFPPVYTHPFAWDAEAEYQGNQPACGAHAGSKHKGIEDNKRYTPRFSWYDIKSFDGNALEAGTDIRSIMKHLTTQRGPLTYKLMPNDVAGSLYNYAHPKVTTAMLSDALKNKGSGYAFSDDLSIKGIKQAIYDHGSVILLMRVTERFWTAANGNTSWAEKDILPLAPSSAQWPVVSGHFVVAHSYDDKYIYFLNSFGPTWGRKGHGYFGANYLPMLNDYAALVGLAFEKDLEKGMTDPDVKKLQVILNKNPKTQVAVSGAGSPGLETEFFGALTFAAVVRFQTLYGITPQSGYVGKLTRAVLNGFA